MTVALRRSAKPFNDHFAYVDLRLVRSVIQQRFYFSSFVAFVNGYARFAREQPQLIHALEIVDRFGNGDRKRGFYAFVLFVSNNDFVYARDLVIHRAVVHFVLAFAKRATYVVFNHDLA